MAKESMKDREIKRAKLVARYAEKRARLKKEGDYQALSRLPNLLTNGVEPQQASEKLKSDKTS